MNNHSYIDFGTEFERILIGLVAILAGIILICPVLKAMGWIELRRYRPSDN